MDDAATVNWGGGWRIPTYDQWVELFKYTTGGWTVQNDVFGFLFTATNGNSLFLPAAGQRWNDEFDSDGCHYWSSSLYIDDPSRAWFYSFYSSHAHIDVRYYRYYGQPVRAVRTVR